MGNYEKRGQPTKYTKELADKICNLVSTHPVGITTLIRDYGLPDRQTIYNWLNTYIDFFDNYMKAKEKQAHVLADDSLEVCKRIPVYTDKEGNERIDSGMLGRAKLELDAIRWSAGKLAPKWYGDSKHQAPVNNEVDDDCKKRYQELDQRNKKEF